MADPAGMTGGLSWTSLVGAALAARVKRRAISLSNTKFWQINAGEVQRQQLSKLMAQAVGTEFGQAHRFDKILRHAGSADQLKAYRETVPIKDWYGFQDQIKRMRELGEPDVLWPGKVMDFAQTSGTTAGDKFIPVSKQMMRSNYLASLDIFAHLMRWGVSLPRMMGGRCLFLGGSSDIAANEHGIRTGDLSGLVTPLIKWPLTQIYSPGPEVALMDHWPSKIEAMARLAIDQDIRFISGMPSWATVLMERVLELARERGGDPKRILDVWPNLFVFVHGGVRFDPFRPRVAELVTGDANSDMRCRHELYPASEGFIAMQDTRRDPGLRLQLDVGNMIEFVPVEEIDNDNPAAFLCDEVEKGQRYVVVLSTCAGLWRYVLGDVVEFETVPNGPLGSGVTGDGPPRIRIVGRHRHFINAFGENIIVEHVENAVAAASVKFGVTIGEFTAAPVYPEGSRRASLELALETDAPSETIRSFAIEFDAALKAQNVDYETKRTESLGMVEPRVTPIAMGSAHRWLDSEGKLGGQHKFPRCANHREIIEPLIEIGRRRS